MHLFIDTNIFLSFYHFTADDLEELKKLAVLLKRKKIQLYLPSQVISEFWRNREAKIADALKKLKDQKLNLQFPQICKDYDEYSMLTDLQRNYGIIHATLLTRLSDDSQRVSLKADAVIGQLFNLAKNIECAGTIIQAAKERLDLGNPPGKDRSLGDAINWEALLVAVPKNVVLQFITDDKDYFSPLDEECFSGFLLREWQERKNGKLSFYKRLSSFFKEHFPDIKLATELEKDILIRDLASSPNFTQTHSLIAKLSKYTDFTPAQINAIVSAAVTNSQVSWIAGDSDVSNFLSTLIAGREKFIEEGTLTQLRSLMNPPALEKQNDDYDVPF